jgi:methylated-DNA-[protein]-cysteine S-methyltransferase
MTVTPFQQRVYAAVSLIPRGKVSTYRDVAEFIGCGSPRAVGQALRVNPFAPQVPCHRVIAASLDLGGFQGKREGAAIERKRRMLASEGVHFKSGRLAEPERVFLFRKGSP